MNHRLYLLQSYYDYLSSEKRFKKWRILRNNQWLNSDELSRIQLLKLDKILDYTAKNIPAFAAMKEKIKSENSTLDKLYKFPITDKTFYRSEGNNVLSKNLKKYRYYKSSTSGSTGENFFFLLDIERHAWAMATKYLTDSWTGNLPHDSRASLWGVSFDNKKGNRIKGLLRNYLTPLSFLSSYNLSVESMNNYISILMEKKPKMIVCYPSPMFEFANYCLSNNVHFPFLKSIISSAEQLFDFQREIIEKAFRVPVFNRYGTREVGNVAQECEKHNGLHVITDRVYVEILDDNDNHCKPGELGQIVITDLDNRVMPLIRYRIGDMAAWSKEKKCGCGRGYPLFEKVEGRAFDVVKTPNGTVISGTFWTLLIRFISEDIKAFQVIQEKKDRITINLQMHIGKSLPKDRYGLLLNKISEKDKDLNVEIKFKDKIELTNSGKRRFVISKI